VPSGAGVSPGIWFGGSVEIAAGAVVGEAAGVAVGVPGVACSTGGGTTPGGALGGWAGLMGPVGAGTGGFTWALAFGASMVTKQSPVMAANARRK